MPAFVTLLVSALLALHTLASPVANLPRSQASIQAEKAHFPPLNSGIAQLLCRLSILPRALCPRQTSSGLSVTTPLGTAVGTQDGTGARFAVKYGSAKRWQESTVATSWQFPNGATDPAALPLACAQTDADASDYTEDCLSALIYVPSSVTAGSKVPTLMWIHGGSFLFGSATDPGLDGTKLAEATQSIVVVVQYRLGALGFMAPSGDTNLAVKDMVTCLKFLGKVIPSFGGDASKITLAGQSSGGNMIRALLAVPSASSLFQSAILQSDPMDYGFLTNSVQSELQDYFNSLLNCSSTDTACLEALSLDAVLDASKTQAGNAAGIDPSATTSEPMRPVNDGSFITNTLDSTMPFPSVSKPILITNVLDEAGPTIYHIFPAAIDQATYTGFVDAFYTEPRSDTVMSSPFYTVRVLADGQAEDARIPLQSMATDGIWRCATWTFARSWVAHGGNVFVGTYTVGAPHPDNSAIAFCQEDGVVCHEDDIQIVFGTVPSPNPAQSALVTEMQARYKAFLYTGNPNPAGGAYTPWSAATSTNVPSLLLGENGGLADIGACETSFWGAEMQYDYQFYDS